MKRKGMMRNELIASRLPPGINKEKLKKKAAEYGLTYSGLVQEGLQILVNLDTPFYKMVKDRAEKLNLPLGFVIENMLLRRFVDGEDNEPEPEFVVINGKMLTGMELYDYLKGRLIQEKQKR